MRHVFAGLLIAATAFAATATAAPRPFRLASLKAGESHRIARPQNAPRTAGEAARKMNRVRANVIGCESSDFSFIFPIAGNVQGNFGTFYRTEITLINYLDTPQVIGVGWLAAGQDNTDEEFTYIELEEGSWTSYADFVGGELGKTGLGAILVVAFDGETGEIDDLAEVDGTSRIWTPQPNGAGGTSSQSFPSVSVIDSLDSFTAVALGLRHGNGFRTNYGVVNLDSEAHTWTIFGGNGGEATLTVPPLSVVQTSVPGSFPTSNGYLVLAFEPNADGFSWSAYASSNDNVTGDGWVMRATQ